MYPCRTFPKNLSPVDMLVSPTPWGRRGVESRLVILGPSSWRRLNMRRVADSCLVLSVVRQFFSLVDIKVYTWRVASQAFAW